MRLVVLALASMLVVGCGGGTAGAPPVSAPPPASPPPAAPPVLPPPSAPPPAVPGAPAPEEPTMLPGDPTRSIGVSNDTGVQIVWIGWWETRVPAPDGGLEPHWHWLVPTAGPIAPGSSWQSNATNGPYVLPRPAPGVLDVVAVGATGATWSARVTYSIPAAMIWVVR